jgi:hypothetical protein
MPGENERWQEEMAQREAEARERSYRNAWQEWKKLESNVYWIEIKGHDLAHISTCISAFCTPHAARVGKENSNVTFVVVGAQKDGSWNKNHFPNETMAPSTFFKSLMEYRNQLDTTYLLETLRAETAPTVVIYCNPAYLLNKYATKRHAWKRVTNPAMKKPRGDIYNADLYFDFIAAAFEPIVSISRETVTGLTYVKPQLTLSCDKAHNRTIRGSSYVVLYFFHARFNYLLDHNFNLDPDTLEAIESPVERLCNRLNRLINIFSDYDNEERQKAEKQRAEREAAENARTEVPARLPPLEIPPQQIVSTQNHGIPLPVLRENTGLLKHYVRLPEKACETATWKYQYTYCGVFQVENHPIPPNHYGLIIAQNQVYANDSCTIISRTVTNETTEPWFVHYEKSCYFKSKPSAQQLKTYYTIPDGLVLAQLLLIPCGTPAVTASPTNQLPSWANSYVTAHTTPTLSPASQELDSELEILAAVNTVLHTPSL